MKVSPREYIADEVPLLAATINARVQPCILGNSEPCSDDEIPVGASKFCGKPDVPAGFEWPMTSDGPCWFLGQLNLADCNRFNAGLSIPGTGLLSFFYHDAAGEVGLESQMIYFDEGALNRIEVVPDTRWGDDFHARHLFSRSIELSQGFCLPDVDDLGLTEDEAVEYDDLYAFVEGFNYRFAYAKHQFFGSARHLWDGVNPSYQLIASFGECEDRIFFYAPKSDVPTLRASQLHVIYEFT